MSNTGHHGFDQRKDEFSAIVRDIEATMHKQASASSDMVESDESISESIRKASKILTKMSSTTKQISETEQPALKQELLDIYNACKMQLKTYKLLYKQTELFPVTNTTHSLSIERSTRERSALFSTSATTPGSIDDPSKYDKFEGSATSRTKNLRDEIVSNTQGRLNNQNSRLRDALRSLEESEQVAQEISGELEGQREMMETTQARMGQFSSMTEHSKNLLNSMNKSWWRKW
jgi:methyl-accepting chemotaxis protein